MDEITERDKSLERQIRAFHWVRLLAELPGRLAGSPAEREAAERIGAWLSDVGIEEASQEAVRSRPALGEDGVPLNYHRAADLPEALDMTTVVRAADFGAAVAWAALRGEAGPIPIF